MRFVQHRFSHSLIHPKITREKKPQAAAGAARGVCAHDRSYTR